MKYILAIGSNIRPHIHVRDALKKMMACFDAVRVGKFFYSPAYGIKSSRMFWNGAVLIETDLSPQALKDLLCGWEQASGRNRLHPKCSLRDRTLDIDIIWGDACGWLESPNYIQQRLYVLLPVASLLRYRHAAIKSLRPVFFVLQGKVLGKRIRSIVAIRQNKASLTQL